MISTLSLLNVPRLSFVGRARDRELLRSAMNRTRAGAGGVVFLVGEAGVGKTRLAEITGEEAARAGFRVACGRAYPVESGVPYASISDALLPLLRSLEPQSVTALARGGLSDLAQLFPGLSPDAERTSPVMHDPVEFKARLLWAFAEFLMRLAQRAPLLLVFDDVHWADVSSLELLHFLARQTRQHPILFLCTYNETERETNPALRDLEKSLAGLGIAHVLRLDPLTLDDTRVLIEQTFDGARAVVSGFAVRLFEWTRGNPFFMKETLQSLIASHCLYERDGRWLGWEIQSLEVPATVRDTVAARLAGLSADARQAAELAAVLGNRFDLEVLRAVWPADDAQRIVALEELRRSGVLNERAEQSTVSYDFTHPIFRQVLYSDLGIARARLLHGRVATALETLYQANALEHADELAYHFARAELRSGAPKAVTYLAGAGRRALLRLADREAANYLTRALELAAQSEAPVEPGELEIVLDLARARQRLGEFDAAVQLFERVRAAAERSNDMVRVAELERRIGLSYYWSSRHVQALAHFDRGLLTVDRSADHALRPLLLLARGACLMELGRADDARADIEQALAMAETQQNEHARARALRALALLHTWCGPPALARQHAHTAIELAGRIGATDVLFMSHWTLAALEGLTGHTTAMAEHIAQAEELASTLGSPTLGLWTAELVVEYAFATGDWDLGLARGEQGIALARTLNQRQLLPRLLVWTALIYLGRGELERARIMIDEAWTVAGADQDGLEAVDVHTVVPVHIGRASYHLVRWEFAQAMRVAQAGLAVADRSGYTFWAIHRLLPIIAEAYCYQQDLDGAARIGQRLQDESTRLGHKLGLAWAQACRALIVWRGGDSESSVRLMFEAVEALEAVPIVPDAARLRRQLAGRLAEIGDRAGALRELRHVHAIFVRLRAEIELEKTRAQFRELGARPPAREESAGTENLTGRELAIARLVAERKSNKAIASALHISPRTVGTHLSSIFRKLEVSSRSELADYIRVHGLRA